MTGVCSQGIVARIKLEWTAMCIEEQYNNIHITIGSCIYVNINMQFVIYLFLN